MDKTKPYQSANQGKTRSILHGTEFRMYRKISRKLEHSSSSIIMPRTRNLFDPKSKDPYKLSYSRLDRFLKCPCCFYLVSKLEVDQVSDPAFTLNGATDTVLKKEFNVCSAKGISHPINNILMAQTAPPCPTPSLHLNYQK